MVALRAGAGRQRLRRGADAALAVLLLASLLVVAPMPTWVQAEELEVRTEAVTLRPRSADRSREALALAGTAPAEAAELRGALAGGERRATGVRRATLRSIGVTVPAAPDGPLLVRGRVDGRWTPWFEVHFAEGEAPDRGTEGVTPGIHSEPVWLGDADAYEIDGPASTTALDVHAIEPVRTTRRLVPGDAAGAAGAPYIRPRSSWGARPPTKHPTVTADLKLAVVHHTVSGNGYSQAQVPSVLRSIQAYHQDVRGYGDIAYNILVDRFGTAWEGRAGGLSNVVLGGHSQGFNSGAVGVSVIGDYRSAGVSSAVFETVARVIAWKLALHRVDPRSSVPYTSAGSAKYAAGVTVTLPRIVGHRDVQSTDCPGGNLYARLGSLRTRVNELVRSYQQGLTPLVVHRDATGDGLADPLEYRPGSGADVQWRSTSSGAFVKTADPVQGTFRPAAGDFDGDGRDDILWHGTGSAPDYIWWSTPTGHTTQAISVGGSYVPVVGDFDGNGADDVFWYATGLAQDHVWYFTGRQHRSTPVREDLITGVPLVGDLNGDALDDIFFYAPGPDADDRLWRSQGQSWRVGGLPANGWYLPVAHDTDGDGRTDLTFFAPGATSSYRWRFSDSFAVTSSALAHPALIGQPYAGDFDGDGLDDVLIFAAGGPDAVWYSTPTGIDVRSASGAGTFAVTPGATDGPPLLGPDPDDVLFVGNGADFVWRGQVDRTFRSTQVG